MVWTRENDGSWADHFAAWLARVHPEVATMEDMSQSMIESLYDPAFGEHVQVANACGYPIEETSGGKLRHDGSDYVCDEPMGAEELAAAQALAEKWERSLPPVDDSFMRVDPRELWTAWEKHKR